MRTVIESAATALASDAQSCGPSAAAPHFCSILPKCHTASATAQVTTNTPTTTNPALLMLKPARNDQKVPLRSAFCAISPSTSTPPMNTATNTESPVMVRL